MKRNALVVAIASLSVGGFATAAYYHHRDPHPTTVASASVAPSSAAVVAPQRSAPVPAPEVNRAAYADVIRATPITQTARRYATVIGAEPVRETVATDVPREVCEDVTVQDRLPERDGNVGGTAIGAVVGGLIGHQVGKGDGRKAATVAGAVAGGFIGNRVDRRHEGGRLVARTEHRCHSVSESITEQRTVAWTVTYRGPDGRIGHLRTERKPGSRIQLGTERTVVGYDVTYRYDGRESRVRMARDPGDRLPVVDGEVVVRAADAMTTRG